jgi:hypothetical protein
MYLACWLLFIVNFKPLVNTIIDDQIAHLKKSGTDQIITSHILIEDSHFDLVDFILNLKLKFLVFPFGFLTSVVEYFRFLFLVSISKDCEWIHLPKKLSVPG